MFMGEYNHSIDAKGRVIIPVKFREELGSEFVVTKGMDGCLYLFPFAAWNEFEEKLRSMPVTVNKESRKFARFFMAGAGTVELDKQGRILIPPVLREFAGLQKNIVIAGVLDRVEIWDHEKWIENSQYDDLDEIAGHMSDIGFIL